MKSIRVFSILLPLALLFALAQPIATGSEWDKKITFTLDAPVEVPGVERTKVIGPGTYVFKVMDNGASQNIVQIWNADETQLITTILAVPDYRAEPSGSPIIKFSENVSGSPPAIREVFYPGDQYGWEFAYSRPRAVEIARANNQNVLSKTETSADPHTLVRAQVNAVTPQGNNAEASTAANANPHN